MEDKNQKLTERIINELGVAQWNKIQFEIEIEALKKEIEELEKNGSAK